MSSGRWFLNAWLVSTVWLISSCSSAVPPATTACAPSASKACGTHRVPWDATGLRVVLSRDAKSVCVLDQGCPEGPKGAVQIRPLTPPIRDAVAQALVALGLELVEAEAERDLVADVEWRGTDTIAVRLEDAHGRFIDQASFSRSLDRCRELPELSWDTCWAANFEPMKAALTQPLEQSAALVRFARRIKGVPGESAEEPTPASRLPGGDNRATKSGALAGGLDGSQLQQTIAHYRKAIERDCWAPVRDARAANAPRSARVSTLVSINVDGSVDEVTSAGDPPGYLHLAPCLVTQIRGWHFPAAARPTRVSIPFVFAAE